MEQTAFDVIGADHDSLSEDSARRTDSSNKGGSSTILFTCHTCTNLSVCTCIILQQPTCANRWHQYNSYVQKWCQAIFLYSSTGSQRINPTGQHLSFTMRDSSCLTDHRFRKNGTFVLIPQSSKNKVMLTRFILFNCLGLLWKSTRLSSL